jgi:DNA polymerase III alpha subunit (gram-positive type)
MSLLKIGDTTTVAVEIVPESYAERTRAIAAASSVSVVTTAAEQATAVTALRSLKALTKQVEASRKEAKAPVLELGRRIDATAETFLRDITVEDARVTALLTAYEVEQRRIAAEAEKVRQAEVDRLAAEERQKQSEIQRQIAEAEKQQREAREAAQNAESRDELAAAARKAEAAKAELLKLGVTMQRSEDAVIVAQSVPVPVAAPPRPAGTSVRQPWTFDLTDIRALYNARPDLCEITPRRSVILAEIAQGLRQLPGIVIRQETKVGVRV